MAESKLNDIIKNSLEKIREMVDVNTVMGDPITTNNGTTIIPISKMAVGFASGGLDYFGKNLPASERNPADKLSSFGGGGGTGLSVTPVGFLVVSAEGSVELLSIEAAKVAADPAMNITESIVDLITKAPELIGKLKATFAKDKGEDEDEVKG